MKHKNERRSNRGARRGVDEGFSPVVGVAALALLTVVLAAVVFVSALGFTGSLDEPTPGGCALPSESATPVNVCGERVVDLRLSNDTLAASGSAEVRIRHVFGEPIASEDIRIEVDAPGGAATIDGLREGGIDDGFARHGLKPANAEVYEDPENIIDSSGFTSRIPEVMEEDDTAFFRLNDDAELDRGAVSFEVTHTPTGTVLVDEDLFA